MSLGDLAQVIDEATFGREFDDGPLIRHLGEIRAYCESNQDDVPADTTRDDQRAKLQERRVMMAESFAKGFRPRILQVISMPRAIDMTRLLGRCSDEVIEHLIERWYVHSEL